MDEDNWPLLDYLLEVADSSMTYGRATSLRCSRAGSGCADAGRDKSAVAGFQLNHLGDLYAKLPRHVGRDLRIIRRAAEKLAAVDLTNLHIRCRARWNLTSGALSKSG